MLLVIYLWVYVIIITLYFSLTTPLPVDKSVLEIIRNSWNITLCQLQLVLVMILEVWMDDGDLWLDSICENHLPAEKCWDTSQQVAKNYDFYFFILCSLRLQLKALNS